MKYVIPVLIYLLISGCTATQPVVNIDYDKEADFSQYDTFFWSEEIDKEGNDDEPILYNSLVKKRIKDAISSEMEGRGYTIDETNPDLLVNFHIVIEEKTAYRSYPGYGYRWWQDDVQPYNYKEGTLIIDLIDDNKNQLVWQGYTEGIVRDNPEEMEKSIREAISLIFSKYEYRAEN